MYKKSHPLDQIENSLGQILRKVFGIKRAQSIGRGNRTQLKKNLDFSQGGKRLFLELLSQEELDLVRRVKIGGSATDEEEEMEVEGEEDTEQREMKRVKGSKQSGKKVEWNIVYAMNTAIINRSSILRQGSYGSSRQRVSRVPMQ